MRRLRVVNNVTLDGVMQAPGRPEEDTRNGFTHGGWAGPYQDQVLADFMARGAGGVPHMLFGRRTYEDFFTVWPQQTDSPFSDLLNRAHKYVASRTLTEPLPWQNSILLHGDAADAVARLKAEDGPDLVLLGSGDLLQTLIAHDLIDEYTLPIYPLTLGTGRRLFRDGLPPRALKLTESVVTTTGVIIANYRPEDPHG